MVRGSHQPKVFVYTAKNSSDNECIRHANFPEDAFQLQRLHTDYSKKQLVTIVRSVQHWKEYVSAELGDTLWVLTKPSAPANGGEDITGSFLRRVN